MSACITLACDGPGCSALSPVAVTGDGTTEEVDQVRRGLAHHGWERIQLGLDWPWLDLCPRCAARVRLIADRRRAREARSAIPSHGGTPA